MTKWAFVFLICVCSAGASAQDFHLRYRPDSNQNQVVSADDIKQLAANGATLEAINGRLTAIDDKLNKIQTTLDKDVLPTIYVMDFFKWLFGALVVAIITVSVNNRLTNRHAPLAP